MNATSNPFDVIGRDYDRSPSLWAEKCAWRIRSASERLQGRWE